MLRRGKALPEAYPRSKLHDTASNCKINPWRARRHRECSSWATIGRAGSDNPCADSAELLQKPRRNPGRRAIQRLRDDPGGRQVAGPPGEPQGRHPPGPVESKFESGLRQACESPATSGLANSQVLNFPTLLSLKAVSSSCRCLLDLGHEVRVRTMQASLSQGDLQPFPFNGLAQLGDRVREEPEDMSSGSFALLDQVVDALANQHLAFSSSMGTLEDVTQHDPGKGVGPSTIGPYTGRRENWGRDNSPCLEDPPAKEALRGDEKRQGRETNLVSGDARAPEGDGIVELLQVEIHSDRFIPSFNREFVTQGPGQGRLEG